jgi:multidrug efflux pump subunit AcrA (membrane-fusion protein)
MTTAPRSAPQRPASRRSVPGLDIASPRRLGLTGLALLVAASAAALAIPVPTGPLAAARGRVQGEPVVVRHDDGGSVARVHVKDGDEVEADALLVTLDARLIDSQIAGLKVQEQANRLRHSGLRQEHDGLAASDRPAAQRQRLQSVEAQMSDIDQELLGLQVRITMAEAERKRTEIRSPVKGRLLKFVAAEGMAMPAQATLALIQPAADRLLLETSWPLAAEQKVAVGQPVAVWPRHALPWATPLTGTIERVVSEDAASRRVRTRIAVDLTGTDLAGAATGPGIRDQDFELQLIFGTPSLAAHFFSPLMTSPKTTLRTPQP